MEHGSLDKKVVIQPSDTKADPTKLGFRAGKSIHAANCSMP